MSNIVNSQKKVGEVLGISQPAVSQLIRAGMPVVGENAYDLEQIQAWYGDRKDKRVVISDVRQIASVDDFKARRADILAGEQTETIRLQQLLREDKLTRKKIRKLTISEAQAWYDTLRKDQAGKFTQERLERGESTENVAIIVSAIKDLKRRRVKGVDGPDPS